jgi:hypothetical protein
MVYANPATLLSIVANIASHVLKNSTVILQARNLNVESQNQQVNWVIAGAGCSVVRLQEVG